MDQGPILSHNDGVSDDDVIDLEGLDGDDDAEKPEEAPAAEAEPEDGAEAKTGEGEGEGEGEADRGQGASAFDHYLASNNQFDDFLAKEDPEFAKSLKALEDIPAGEGDVKDDMVELDPGLLKEESVGVLNFIRKFEKILKPYFIVAALLGYVTHHVRKWVLKVVRGVKWAFTDGKEQVIGLIKLGFQKLKEPIVYSIQVLKKMRWRGRVILLVLLVAGFVLTNYFRKIWTGSFLPHTTAQSVTNYKGEADRIFWVDFDRGVEPFDSPLRHAQYIVLLKRVTANVLASPGSSANPMGLFEVFVEATNQEVAVEIKDRETELVDRFMRTIEEMTYDEVRSPEGKKILKKLAKKEFNQVLNKGRVKKVYFGLITLKP